LTHTVDGLRHQGRPKRQWMDDIEQAVATFSWRRCHKTGSSKEERQ